MLLCGAIGYMGSRWQSGGALQLPMPELLAGLVMAFGVALNLLPKLAFRRVGTTVNPLRPATSSMLVTHGVYRYTRNPMYLGMALGLVAVAVYLASVLALAGPLVFVHYMNRLQIGPEEAALEARFGSAFADYKRRVRRWL